MQGFVGDLRLAARRLAATPLFSIFAVMSLAVGVGLTTAVYSIVDSIFLRDTGIRDPDRLLFVVTPYDGRMLKGFISVPEFHHLRLTQTSFRDISASTTFHPPVVLPSGTELLQTEAVVGNYFSTVGIDAAIGRTIQTEDDEERARVVVLSHSLWRSRFGADRGIVGRTIRISGEPFEIIGVVAAPFEGASGGVPGTRVWIPLGVSVTAPREDHLLVFGRLALTRTTDTASAELGAIAANLDGIMPLSPARPMERRWKAKSITAITQDDTLVRRAGLTIVSLVVLVLAVACTNLANLVLARGTTRQSEIAVRRALGASRWRLVREQSAESLIIAIAGAAAAALVFQYLRALFDVELNVPLPMGGHWTLAIQPVLNVATLGIAVSALMTSLVVFGIEPAVQLTRASDIRGLLAASTGGAANPRKRRQRMLLRWQIAVAAGFFIIATMFVKYTIEEARHDSGIAIGQLGVAVVDIHAQQWGAPRMRRTVERVVEIAKQDPAVEAVSISSGMPYGVPTQNGVTLALPGVSLDDPSGGYKVTAIRATPSIFRVLGVPIVRGRGFNELDLVAAAPVVVLSDFAARRVFRTADAVGQPVRVQRQHSAAITATVIGLARDTDVGQMLGEPRGLVYLPWTSSDDPFLTIGVRSTAGASAAVRTLRKALRNADPDLAVDAIGTGRTMLAGPYVFLRAAGMAALALGMVTLLLAMVGLFGIQSHIVANRTREIGVRMSLGATASEIKMMVLKEGCRPVFEGLAIGLFMGFAGRAIVRSYLDAEVSIVDAWMLLVVPIPLVMAALCACYLPASRASALQPSAALRHI